MDATGCAGVCRGRAQPRPLRGASRGDQAVRAAGRPSDAPTGSTISRRTYDALVAQGLEDRIVVDFSVMSSFDYYTGIVFEAYSPFGGSAWLGRTHDRMIGASASIAPAAGFAFSLEDAMASAAAEEACARAGSKVGSAKENLRIAIPKSSLPIPTPSRASPPRPDYPGSTIRGGSWSSRFPAWTTSS